MIRDAKAEEKEEQVEQRGFALQHVAGKHEKQADEKHKIQRISLHSGCLKPDAFCECQSKGSSARNGCPVGG